MGVEKNNAGGNSVSSPKMTATNTGLAKTGEGKTQKQGSLTTSRKSQETSKIALKPMESSASKKAADTPSRATGISSKTTVPPSKATAANAASESPVKKSIAKAASTKTASTHTTAARTEKPVEAKKTIAATTQQAKANATPKPAETKKTTAVAKRQAKVAAPTKTMENSQSPSKATKQTSIKEADSSAPAVYDENSIQHLEGLEHIRLRPGMYIGSLGDGSNENDGIYILLKEGIDNAVDEFSQGFGAQVEIEIKDDRVKIRDFGRGIPLGKLDDCVSNVNTGAKYNNSVFKQAIGMNGVGIKATNALSSYFRAASVRDEKIATVIYEHGKKISQTIGKTKPGVKNGTYLEFVPDREIFGKYQFNMEMVEKRLWNYAYLNPGLKIRCNGTTYTSENGLEDLLLHEMGSLSNAMYKTFSYKGKNLEFVMTHTASLDKFVYSFVNGQSTDDGGTHVTAFLDGITKGVNGFFKKEYEQSDVTSGLLVALKIGLDNPMFTSQTKNKLGNVEIRIPIINETQAAIDDWLRHNPDIAGSLEDKIIRNQRARAEINNVTEKQVRDAAKTVSLKIPKLKDCRYHLQDGEKGANSMIFITEGDSATGSMVNARDVTHQAIFSLRGKPENMFGRKKTALFDNEELKNLTFSLGVQKDVADLRYQKIVIATDADNDGYHIRNLVMTYLLLYFEELVLTGHVYILETPLFRVRNKKETVYCYSEDSRDSEVKRLGSGVEVTRFKGLGEINGDEFGQFIHPRKEGESEDKGIHLTPVSIQTLQNVPHVLEFYMGKNTPERREFIVHHLASEIDA